MASGKSLSMRYMDEPEVRRVRPEDRRERDRSLPGKARIKARKAARRAQA